MNTNIKKYVIITGASRGIGKAAALKFAKEGYNLILICHKNEALLSKAAVECNEFGVECMTFAGDIGDYEFCKSIFTAIHNLGIRVDILVNNAGISYVGLLQDMTIEEWHHITATNLTSVFSMSSLIIPHFLKNGGGKIINISSVWGNVGASCEVAYSATKGGINAFTKALGKELAPSNIQVNAIAFGAIDTDMNKCFSEEDLKALAEEIPAGRLGAATEAGEMIFSVATMNKYVNGQVINMDGGWI